MFSNIWHEVFIEWAFRYQKNLFTQQIMYFRSSLICQSWQKTAAKSKFFTIILCTSIRFVHAFSTDLKWSLFLLLEWIIISVHYICIQILIFYTQVPSLSDVHHQIFIFVFKIVFSKNTKPSSERWKIIQNEDIKKFCFIYLFFAIQELMTKTYFSVWLFMYFIYCVKFFSAVFLYLCNAYKINIHFIVMDHEHMGKYVFVWNLCKCLHRLLILFCNWRCCSFCLMSSVCCFIICFVFRSVHIIFFCFIILLFESGIGIRFYFHEMTLS